MRRSFRFHLVGLLVLTLLLASMPTVWAQTEGRPLPKAPVPAPPIEVMKPCLRLDLSTGTTQPFTPDAFGTVDPHWEVTAAPANLSFPGPVYSIQPHASWATTSGANWVDPFNTGGSGASGFDPVGNYRFVTSFTVGPQYTNIQLHVNRYGADNRVELYLDGSSTPLGPAATFTSLQGPLAPVSLTPGTHTLEARVRNDSGWMGLLVDARVTAHCRADLAISKRAAGPYPWTAGQNGTYQIAVTNLGPGASTGPIYVTDALPAGATLVSATGSGWNCTSSGSTVTCVHNGLVPANTSLPLITIVVTVPQGVSHVQNCAAVAAKGDYNPRNDKDCVDTEVTNELKPGTICGMKYHDLNGNGVQDSGEPGLANWTIQLLDAAGNVVATVTTDQSGRYCFKEVKPGTYTVMEVQQTGWTQTAPAAPGTYTVTLASSQVLGNIVFGNLAKKECCLNFRFPAGLADNFAQPMEPASPGAGLSAWMATYNRPIMAFDDTRLDAFFGHTFTLPQGNCIRGAWLRFRVRPNGGGSYNDSVLLNFFDASGNPAASGWGGHMGNFGSNPLSTNAWTTGNYPNGATFTLNLASLPGGGNLVPTLNSLRYLDLAFQDDTSVDYATLVVRFCECGKHTEHEGTEVKIEWDLTEQAEDEHKHD